MMEPFLSCLSLFLQHLTQDVAHGRHWVSEWERRLNVGKEYCEVIVSGSSQQTGVRVRSSPYFLSLCVVIKNCVQVVGNRTVLRGVEAMYYWEAFEDCTIWLEAILHWHFWAEAQTFLKDSEPSVLILNLSSFFFFSFQWYQNHRVQSLSCLFKLQWIMALKLFSSLWKLACCFVLSPNGYCRFSHFNILDRWFFFFLFHFISIWD